MMDITFYGERGLVNGLVLDLGEDLENHKKFLSLIKFNDCEELSWIPNIVKVPSYIIEPSLAEFGNPDFIAIAEETNGERHAIFFEAKICSYNDASIDINKTKNLFQKNQTSKLNVQMALKFRFANAFRYNNKAHIIGELPDAVVLYGEKIRNLKKKTVINICNYHFAHCTDFLFVALTNDNANIKPYNEECYLPPIGKAAWENYSKKFGLISYEMLENAGVLNRNAGYYGLAAKAMLALPADRGGLINKDIPNVNTINKKDWTIGQRIALESFTNKLKTKVPEIIIDPQEGSYSIILKGRTLIKCYAIGTVTYIAFRNDNLPYKFENSKIVYIGVGKRRRSFAIVYAGDETQLENKIIEDVIEFIEMNTD